MKHLVLVVAATLSVCAPLFAQPNGKVIQVQQRRGGGFGGRNGNGFGPQDPNALFYGARPENASIPAPPPAPPVSMFADGPYLFVLRGDSLFQFDKKTLKLLNSTELPRPVAPVAAPNSGDMKTYTAPPLRPGTGF